MEKWSRAFYKYWLVYLNALNAVSIIWLHIFIINVQVFSVHHKECWYFNILKTDDVDAMIMSVQPNSWLGIIEL
jgi:hypothetical protein